MSLNASTGFLFSWEPLQKTGRRTDRRMSNSRNNKKFFSA